MKVIEGGTQWFKDVLKVREKYGLDTWLFEIERHGEAGDTKTKYTILPETKVDADLRSRMAPVELHDLSSIGVGDDDEDDDPRAKGAPGKPAAAAPAKPSATDVAAVISENAALELIGRLKSLPRPEAEMLVKRFGISRVREMKASDEAAARRFLEDLERKHGVAAPTEVDPFV
jgi:hypothetical protein